MVYVDKIHKKYYYYNINLYKPDNFVDFMLVTETKCVGDTFAIMTTCQTS